MPGRSPLLARSPLPWPFRLVREVNLGDSVFRLVTGVHAGGVLLLLLALALVLATGSFDALTSLDAASWLGVAWAPLRGEYGAAPLIYGSVVTSLLALALAAPAAVVVAVFLTELSPPRLRRPLGAFLELAAVVPSVVYGLWGMTVLAPAWSSSPDDAAGLGTASVVLAIMILPTITAVSRAVLRAVPGAQREAAQALGATRWEMVRRVVLPYARPGLVGAALVGLGRAIGESVAVAMVLRGRGAAGAVSSRAVPATLASALASPFDASFGMHRSALTAVGLVLLALTLALNVAARVLVVRVRADGGGRP